MSRLRRRLLGWAAAAGTLMAAAHAGAQTVGVLSVYEGQRILTVSFDYHALPDDEALSDTYRREVENAFQIRPFEHYSRIRTEYFLSQVRMLPIVADAALVIVVSGEGGLELTVSVSFRPRGETTTAAGKNIFRNPRSFPVLYARRNTYLTLRGVLSEMVFANDNAWFARPGPFTEGNPLADAASGAGWGGWVEGYAMAGLYGITRIVPSWQLHVYGGASGIAAFSAGRELFTQRPRLDLGVEDAYFGLVGGGTDAAGRGYAYNALFGRRSFVLGNGWLIVNTSMNGGTRAALQLSPRWAGKRLLLLGGRYGRFLGQLFQLRPDALRILDNGTVLDGANVEYTPATWAQTGASVLYAPRSEHRYYLPDGGIRSRRGLWVYNLRCYGNPPQNRPGPFYKAELGYQRNEHFPMRAFAWYIHAGWNFARAWGSPALSYRFAYFSGDDPATPAYERWDALYTGGNGEQWVQGTNMYKVVQNSNEMTHLVQLVFNPAKKLQIVGQVWAFAAPERCNLGGNPALSMMRGRYYGTEFDLTLRYFRSTKWYLHTAVGYTLPGDALRRAAPHTRDWFSFMFFFRYNL